MRRVHAPKAALHVALHVAVSAALGVVPSVGLALGCAPDITPPWRIDGTRDLAAQIVVTERGPVGQPQPDDPARPLHEALPFDTVRAIPLVVDGDGLIPPEDLELRWVACASLECTNALLEYDTLPACDGTLLLLGDDPPCAAGQGPTAELTLDIAEVELGETALSSFLPAAAIVGIGSVRGDPGAQECQRRLEDRSPLGDCFVLHQNISIGSFSELVEFFQVQGFTVDTTDVPESFLLRPRNRTPAIETFAVEGLGGDLESTVVEAGSTLRVTPGATLSLRYQPDELDLEMFEVEASDGTPLRGSDVFQSTWFATADHDMFEVRPQLSEVTLTLGPSEETSLLYVLVRDGAGSVNAGWLRLDSRVAR